MFILWGAGWHRGRTPAFYAKDPSEPRTLVGPQKKLTNPHETPAKKVPTYPWSRARAPISTWSQVDKVLIPNQPNAFLFPL